jgi:hypothetical protein
MTDYQNIIMPMQPLDNHLCGIADRMFQGAFPDDGHAPAKGSERLHMASVAFYIFLKFLPPEVLIGSRRGCEMAAFVPVPEATVDKYHCAIFRKYEIGRSGQFLHMEPVAKPSGKKQGAKCPFRPGVLSADVRHHAAALWSGRNTHGLCVGWWAGNVEAYHLHSQPQEQRSG